MPTTIIHPDQPLRPEELDAFLTAGYRPAGQSIYSCDYLRTDDDAVYGCVQLRLPLADFRFRKSHRRLLNRHSQRFRSLIVPAGAPDFEMEQVNDAYLEVFPDKSHPDLNIHLRNQENGLRILNTHCVKVYEEDRLVAFSFFDVGYHALYSKTGIYDPAYARESLGTYTLLLEIEWAVANGFTHYHPGYYVPEYPRFNYKLDFGPAEYLSCTTGNWTPLAGNDPALPPDPYRQVETKLQKLAEAFATVGITSTLKEYPSFTARLHFPNARFELVDCPFLLELNRSLPNGRQSLVTYDNPSGLYRCIQAGRSRMRDGRLLATGPTGYQRYPLPIYVAEVLATGDSPKSLLAALFRRTDNLS